MIASREFGFCFLHIPKCGGMSVRRLIGRYDSLRGEFIAETDIIPGGIQQKAHLPPATIREFFPEVFQLICGLEKYAILRDPEARFVSALSQRARESHGMQLFTMSQDLLLRDLDRIREELSVRRSLPSYEFRFFIPQSEFARLDGEIFIERLVPLERMDDLVSHWGRLVGRTLDTTRANQTVSVPSGLVNERTLAVQRWMKRALPGSIYQPIRRAGLSLLAKPKTPEWIVEKLEKADFRSVVREFYPDDHALLEHARRTLDLTEQQVGS